MIDPEAPRTAIVCIFGAPNAGKSTLVNRLVGQKISIVTRKVQTTRFPVRGIVMHGSAQIVLIDTPGIFSPRRRLDRAMVRSAWMGAEEADLRVHLVDAAAHIEAARGEGGAAARRMVSDDEAIVKAIQQNPRPTILALNKVDDVPRDQLLPLAARLSSELSYSDVFMISGKQGSGVADLLDALARAAPLGPWLYPVDQVSDAPLRLLAAEITREKLMMRLHEELPYAANVETLEWKEQKDGSVRIEQNILVAREGHRKIALGRNGRAIKDIGQSARLELSEMLERPVHLFLHVKVDEHWEENRRFYEPMGLDFSA